MSMIHEITGDLPRYKKPQRKGRGESSGRGKTCGRGNKGSKARVGTTYKPTYEGGQTEIFRRFPKRGFNNANFERKFHIVNLAELESFDDGATVDAAALEEKGLIPDMKLPVKILGDGAISKKLTVVAGWYTKSAHQKIGDAGGTAQNAKGEAFAFPKPKKKFIPREPVKKSEKVEEPAEAAPPVKAETKAAEPTPDAKPAESAE
jgi:large subunit ribosomal protein L15